ncbi:MAG: hypothetical protein FWH43_00525 [Endomicrobia bacterium]|nr:hypothetical protein [Endomicrobiia bacterium]
MSTKRLINKIVFIGAIHENKDAVIIFIRKAGTPIEVHKERIMSVIEREGDVSIFNYLVANHSGNHAANDIEISAQELLRFNKEIAAIWKHDLRNDLYDCLLYYINEYYGNGDNAGNMFDEIERFLSETKGITDANGGLLPIPIVLRSGFYLKTCYL